MSNFDDLIELIIYKLINSNIIVCEENQLIHVLTLPISNNCKVKYALLYFKHGKYINRNCVKTLEMLITNLISINNYLIDFSDKDIKLIFDLPISDNLKLNITYWTLKNSRCINDLLYLYNHNEL